ncbi:MAG: hypothetical protein OXN97_09055 [Bryobacterales bacterium]|nr:hypothetical protein [Bryobacterales bacterium]
MPQPAQLLALGGGVRGTSQDLGQAQAHVARAQAAGMQTLAQAQQLRLQVEQAGGTGLAHDGGGHDGDWGLAQGRGLGGLGDLEAKVTVRIAEAV